MQTIPITGKIDLKGMRVEVKKNVPINDAIRQALVLAITEMAVVTLDIGANQSIEIDGEKIITKYIPITNKTGLIDKQVYSEKQANLANYLITEKLKDENNVLCAYCGEEYRPINSKYHNGKTFCSVSCVNNYKKDNIFDINDSVRKQNNPND